MLPLWGVGILPVFSTFPFFKNDHRFNVIKFFERSTTRALAWFPNIDIVSNFEKLLTDEVDLIVISQ